MPEVVSWNREYLRDVNGGLLERSRVEVLVADVCRGLTRRRAGELGSRCIIDVDNGPFALVGPGSGRLYAAPALRRRGPLPAPAAARSFWSAAPDPAFMTPPRRRPASVPQRGRPPRPIRPRKRRSHMLFIADRPR